MTPAPAMSYAEFCRAYWKAGFHYPYAVPRHDDPSPAPSYREFVEVSKRLGRENDYHDRGLNLIRACYEYLAGPEGKVVELPQVLTFLNQPCEELLATLAGYQPVYVWLLSGSLLVEDRNQEDVFRERRMQGATEAARYYVQECLIELNSPTDLAQQQAGPPALLLCPVNESVNDTTPASYSLGQKAIFVLVAAAGSLFLGAVLAPDVLPQPARQVQGFVVGKRWRPRWVHKRRIVPAEFFVIVANAESYRTLRVDSLRWASFRLGQPASYRFQPQAFWE